MRWREIITPCGPFVDSLGLNKVIVQEDGARMMVCLTGASVLSTDEFGSIKKALNRAFSPMKVTLRVQYPALGEDVCARFSAYDELVRIYILSQHVGAAPYLADAQMQMHKDELTIAMEDEIGAAYLMHRNVPEMLVAFFQETFCVQVRIHISARGTVEKNLADVLEKRKQETKLMTQEATRPRDEDAPDIEEEELPVGNEILGKPIYDPPVPIGTLRDDSGLVCIFGECIDMQERELKGDMVLFTFALTDGSGTITCKAFIHKRARPKNGALGRMIAGVEKKIELLREGLKISSMLRVQGPCSLDTYAKEITIMAYDIMREEKKVRNDTATDKRVELHAHTQMSSMDGICAVSELIAQAAAFGHKAIAITDHGVVQAFPEAFGAAKKHGIKLLPGVEGYLADDSAQVVENPRDFSIHGPFVVFDLETTGLSPKHDGITEIGAVRMEEGKIVGEYKTFVNPQKLIPEKIQKLTGITNQMVQHAPKIDEVIDDFLAFCEGAVLCAHNASFDMSFIRAAMALKGLKKEFTVLDTLALSREVYTGVKNYRLGTLASFLKITLLKAHRAVDDAKACASILLDALAHMQKRGAENLHDVNELVGGVQSRDAQHIILLAKNQTGLKNIYRLVSESHLYHFRRRPHIPRSLLRKWREGIIVGSACEAGELFAAILDNKPEKVLLEIAKFYDYLEIQSTSNNAFLVRNGKLQDEDALRAINRKILSLGDELGLPVVATGDVHFLHPQDEIYRAILMAGMGFEDADQQAPLYLKTTQEMLDEFAYLGEDRAREVVIDNPNQIADWVENITLFPIHPEGKETFQPYWEDAEQNVRSLCQQQAEQIYGTPLPEIVTARLDKELSSICGNGFSTLYWGARLLVQKSLSDGYLVGSRGSVGSSFVAHMIGITEVNALPPHYICPSCRYSSFDVDLQAYPTGVDLPKENCPDCGAVLRKDGYDIPFEVFLGFYGDKVPDIDLNFSGDYQAIAHKYVEELFGKENTYRAGTIGTLADKTAYGYVVKYLEERGRTVTRAEVDRLVRGCVGVKRTTGQHPGGMVVLPNGFDIYDFTPIQHPADDTSSTTMTTHFDFNSMHDIVVKLDILGHDDPTMIRNLEDITGINALEIPLDDEKVMSLFRNTTALGVTPDELGSTKGTLGVPEFGTKFVRGMLEDTMPTTMSELVRISGLSHGKDVWLDNARDLVTSGTATLSECICTRDDIMNALIACGVESKMAFTTMESVRKGKGLTDAMEKAMIDANVPPWFIESCKKIEYMFPKAHAVAYVTMSLRIAYFKVYHPKAYYSSFFTIRADEFDAGVMLGDVDNLRKAIEDIEQKGKEATAKEQRMVTIIELVIEMNLRGIHFLPIDLYESDAVKFLIKEDGLLPPLNSIGGLGENAARAIVAARGLDKPFISVEDMQQRGKIGKATTEMLREAGCLSGMPQTSQISLFG